MLQLRKNFAKLIGAKDYNRIANIPSVSYGIATITNNIKLKAGEEILLIDEQFPSNYYSWQRLADQYEATIKTIAAPNTKIDRGAQWNEAILNGITDKTAVVTLGNIHWSNGTLFHLKAIREKSKQHGALLIVDGSQSIGAYPFL